MPSLSWSEPTQLTQGFWSEAAHGRLVRPVCLVCGRSFFTPRVACPHCLATRWEYRESAGQGMIVSHTTVHRGPDPTWDAPYVLGAVAIDEGWTLLTRLLVEPPDEQSAGALIGERVAVSFVDAHPPDDRRLPAFRLAESVSLKEELTA